MKHYLHIALLTTLTAFAQGSIKHITPEELAANIKNSSKATVVQYWVPNCAQATEIVTNYKKLEEAHAGSVDFYFVGLTNKDSLVQNLMDKTGYRHDIYVIDKSVDEDLMRRKETFGHRLCKLLGTKEKDFITLYMDRNDRIIYKNDDVNVDEKKLKKILG